VNDAQQSEAEVFIREQTELKRFPNKIVTLVESAKTFYPAEEYHQDYIAKNGAFCHVANPW
jgi:peptide methionine sulfoxide reductase MsrA